ncbi:MULTISPECIES: hypothetical protein [Nostoc]|nr:MULTISPECIES: hypothetical protein [Nostoc]
MTATATYEFAGKNILITGGACEINSFLSTSSRASRALDLHS